MAGRISTRRIRDAISALRAASDPISRLEAARATREAADELEAFHIAAARTAGVTWSQIGACYGLTKQGAHQRFRAYDRRVSRVEQPEPGSAPDAD